MVPPAPVAVVYHDDGSRVVCHLAEKLVNTLVVGLVSDTIFADLGGGLSCQRVYAFCSSVACVCSVCIGGMGIVLSFFAFVGFDDD